MGQEPASAFVASTRAKVVNFVLFQAVWAACVLGAAEGMPWAGVLVALIALPLYLACLPATERRRELSLIALAGTVGLVLDSALLALGAIDFPEAALGFPPTHPLARWLAPPWIVVLWCAVGSMLRSSLAWLGRDLRLAVALAALSGPLSFLSGERLGATLVPHGAATLGVLSFEYAVVLPILLGIARRPAAPPAVTRPPIDDVP